MHLENLPDESDAYGLRFSHGLQGTFFTTQLKLGRLDNYV